jgi:hypothetical protein
MVRFNKKGTTTEMMQSTIVYLASFAILVGVPCYGEPKLKSGQGYIQGYVKEDGKPIKDVEIVILGPPYLQKNDWAVPIITPRVVGVVGVNSPPSVNTSGALRRTDKNGHYEAVLPIGQYSVRAKNGSGGGIRRLVEVQERKGATQDFDIGIKWHAAELAVEEFNRGFGSILMSAKEEAPFTSMVVPYLPSVSITRVTLPGADTCGAAMMPVAGGTTSMPVFNCSASYSSHERALEDYGHIVKLVAAATGLTPTPSSTPPTPSMDYKGDNLTQGDSLTVFIYNGNVVIQYSTLGRVGGMDNKKP